MRSTALIVAGFIAAVALFISLGTGHLSSADARRKAPAPTPPKSCVECSGKQCVGAGSEGAVSCYWDNGCKEDGYCWVASRYPTMGVSIQ